jgi:beta-lactam-binding protein with PASTA domain
MKFRRHRGEGLSVSQWFAWVPQLRDRLIAQTGRHSRLVFGGGSIIASFLIGYVIAVFILFPAPIFARTETVPRVLGLGLGDASQLLTAAGIVVNDTDYVSHPTVPRGSVVWQDPPPGIAVPPGTGMTLSLSRGPQPIPIPDVTGYEQDLARRLIETAGLTVASIDTTIAPQDRGVVVSTRPPAGQSRMPGDGVTLFVSVGAPSITVPDLKGLTLDEARALLEQLGLVLGSTSTRSSTQSEPGLIIDQNPAAGTLSAEGAAVRVTLVRGERP